MQLCAARTHAHCAAPCLSRPPAARCPPCPLRAAAGKDADRHPMFPASYELDCIVSVAASRPDDSLAPFSNYGASSVHLAAPGVNIRSCLNSADDAYTWWVGWVLPGAEEPQGSRRKAVEEADSSRAGHVPPARHAVQCSAPAPHSHPACARLPRCSRRLSGTSMATPIVSGAAALLFSAKPQATNSEVRWAGGRRARSGGW